MDENITVFRSRLRHDVPADYDQLADELEARGRTVPGFVEFKEFVAADGERLALVTFASDAAEAAWRDDDRTPRRAGGGPERFYSEYDVAVCSVLRRHVWQSSGT